MFSIPKHSQNKILSSNLRHTVPSFVNPQPGVIILNQPLSITQHLPASVFIIQHQLISIILRLPTRVSIIQHPASIDLHYPIFSCPSLHHPATSHLCIISFMIFASHDSRRSSRNRFGQNISILVLQSHLDVQSFEYARRVQRMRSVKIIELIDYAKDEQLASEKQISQTNGEK